MSPSTPTSPPTDPEMWASVLNLFYWLERDEEFVWLRSVRATVEEAERKEGKAA